MKTSHAERNAAIVRLYLDGAEAADLAQQFRLSGQRIHQILGAARARKRGRVTVPAEDQKMFLGVSISPDTKFGMADEAKRRGVSVSQLTGEMLDAGLKAAE